MFKQLFCYLLLPLFVLSASAVEVVKPRFKTADLVLAEEVLVASDHLTEDCSLRLQAAINSVAAQGGGTVFLCAGYYTMDGPVVVKEGVTLRGDHPQNHQDVAQGTVIRIMFGRGDEDGTPAFTVERGSGLRGLTLWYPEQSAAKPVQYPWTVFASEQVAGDNQSIFDCVFVNSWRAVRIGPGSNELHTLRRLKICALKTGIFIDSTTDIGRLSNLSISPAFWIESGLPGAPQGAQADIFCTWLLAVESCGLIIGRSDWEYIWRLNVTGYNRGVVFTKGKRGTTNAVMADSDITACKSALYVEALNLVGLSIYNSRLHGVEHSVVTSKEFNSVVQFHTCDFIGDIRKDDGGIFSFKSCSMENLTAESGEILMCDCSFESAVIGKTIKRARILGFDRKKCVVKNLSEGGDVAIAAKITEGIKPIKVAPLPAVIPRPTSDALFVVTHYGASVELEDNAVAFQSALNAAEKNKGGGTVYVPAGYYNFRNDIVVPSGVELRGSFDVPHHTISDGSVLMPRHNAGIENGAAFVKLERGSGLRGLSFWYPEQPLSAPQAYPWCVQSHGKGCWIVDTNIGNAWQGVDFASHRSDGHVVQYLSGAMYKRGLFVGNSKKAGWVEDVQFNPHYMGRRSKTLPYNAGPGWKGDNLNLIEYQRQHLKGIVFKDCHRENIRGTFLYAAHEGIAFYGKCDANILMHGSDTVSRAAYLNTDKGSQLRFALTQLVSIGKFMESAFVASKENKGAAIFQNSQVWAGDSTARFDGKGVMRLEQFNTLSGPVTANSGTLEMELGVFMLPLSEQLVVGGNADVAALSCINKHGSFRVEGEHSSVKMTANSNVSRLNLPINEEGVATIFKSSFEERDAAVPLHEIALHGGGMLKVSNSETRVVKRADAHSGDQALLFTGHSDDPAYSYVYHVINSDPVLIMQDTTLSYWKKALNENGRATAFDLYFKSGKALRMEPIGHGHHAGTRAGFVGEWKHVVVNLGALSGEVITKIIVCYDTRSGGGPFEVLFDDVTVGSELSALAWQVGVTPSGGLFDHPPVISIERNPSAEVFYTLDGTNPTILSTRYTQPFKLPANCTTELRYAPLGLNGDISNVVFGELYEVN